MPRKKGIKSTTKVSLLESREGLIGEICAYLAQGATDSALCRIIGINPQTFAKWKIYGQEGNGDKYEEFYKEYEKAVGYRELSWLDGIDGKWLLIHHPTTKYDYAEVKHNKQEFSLSPLEEEARNKVREEAIAEGLGNIKTQIEAEIVEDRSEEFMEVGETVSSEPEKKKRKVLF